MMIQPARFGGSPVYEALNTAYTVNASATLDPRVETDDGDFVADVLESQRSDRHLRECGRQLGWDHVRRHLWGLDLLRGAPVL